ncbi:MAG: flagellar hook protein FlgE [Polymorphobacter sp.]|uniref:flagellar hook protein FlgE n=1 Tax=Polymorphobacter sp. TaxID=1909290 RepID=UPI003A84CD13
MAFYTALTGLTGAQAELSTLANNIANVGTHGFKRSRVAFGDIISASPLQNPNRVIGSGGSVRTIAQQFIQGAIEGSESALDLAITGQGFFVMKGGSDGNSITYSRNGAFSTTADRFIVDAAGRQLQLFPTTTDGSVLTTDLDSTIPARLPLQSGFPVASTSLAISVNLPASAAIIPDSPIYTPTNPYVFDSENPATFNNSTSTTLYDSNGNALAATIYYVKLSAASVPDPVHRWEARVLVGGTELNVGGTPGIPLEFDTAGVLTAPTTPLAFDPLILPGAEPLTLSVDHGIATSQFTGGFARNSVAQDGVPVGQLESVAVDRDGIFRVSFTNGEVQALGQLALANFSNPQGLKAIGDASYVTAPQSGEPIAGVAGRNGFGGVLSGSLERSNVDLTTELVSLIAAQRNFQASAKAIETDTTLLQTIINQR